ncbi:FMN-binding negative transcriptional regulator [Streptacidiphilus carbonis]|jgi:transcriptional regulator|uniref:FMN-binding negative transcriptional regulator n=1 Tax=Streptacidiphilus carbonis TaxID=105422 RepID=UPI0005A740CE|nr:FMN-binding negative transcriptional regulator [Streptacidiphilus carbonis]
MLINPWDRGADDEWRAWLSARDFGVLAANGPDGAAPVLVPTQFLYVGSAGAGGGDEVLLHLARPNPVWAAIEANPRVTLAVTDDYAFVPGPWRAPADTPPEDGVPTTYYASVHLVCTAEPVDDPAAKAALLDRQTARMQPDVPHRPIVPGEPPFGRMLSAIRGLRLRIEEVRPKFKYDDKKTTDFQTAVAEQLRLRDRPADPGARTQLLRRRDVRLAGPEGCPVEH